VALLGSSSWNLRIEEESKWRDATNTSDRSVLDLRFDE
jgi:hypothetical protein